MRRQKILFNFFLLSFLWAVEAYATTCYSAYTPSISSTQQTVCSGNTVTLSAYGNLRDNYYWSWYKDGCATIPLGNGYNKNVTPTVTTTYYARGEGGCASPGPCGQITINVIPGIAAPTVTPSFQCQPGVMTLQAAGSTNQTIDWFNVANGGGVITGGYNTNVFITPFLNSSTTYYAQARDTITGCYSSIRTPVTANIGILINNQWNSKANFPGAIRYGGVGFSLNGKGYIGTGINTSVQIQMNFGNMSR